MIGLSSPSCTLTCCLCCAHMCPGPLSPLQDFLAALPVRCYTEPRLGVSSLNLATALQTRDNPTDLGPKCYIAYGRVAEAQGEEGDSVTKCHCDMTGDSGRPAAQGAIRPVFPCCLVCYA